MSQTTLSSALYIAVYDILKDHFLTEKDRLTLLLPLKSDLPKSFDQIDFDDASGAFTVHLIDVLQQYPDEFDVVLEAASKWVGVDKSAEIHVLRKKVKDHYATVRPQVIDDITQTVTDGTGKVIPTSQQILHTLDQLAAAAPKRTSQRNRRLVTRLLWQFGIFAVVVGVSTLTNQMADLFVRSLGISGILAALSSSVIQYFIRVDELKADENAVTVALNAVARGIGWLSAALIGVLFGGLLFTTVGVGWGLAACAYGLPLIYAIWALLPPQQADYLIHARDAADPRTQDLDELRDRVRRYWLEGILRRGLEEQVGEMNINLEQNALIYDEAGGAFKVEAAGEGDIPRTSMSIYRLYRHFAYRFFILGEPGSGKTIMLLRLAADMLADKGRPYLPLVLNLSSYRGGDLAEWIVKEGAATYNVAARTLQDWHDRRLFALLLDGLDEIPDDAPHHYRAQCARAINAYIAAQDANRDLNRASVVVCSRVAEHTLMLRDNPDAQLHALANRVTLQPLERTQIDQIITPQRYPALHATLQHDPILRGEEVAGVPFLLNAMVYAYGNKTDENELRLPDGESGIVARRNHLIRAYLLRRFNDPTPLPDSPEDLLRWLRWIAARTLATGTIFKAGVLPLRWLEGEDQRRIRAYSQVLWGLFGVLVALPLGLLVGYGVWQGIAALSSLSLWGTLYGWITAAWWTLALTGLGIIAVILLAVRGREWLWDDLLQPTTKALWKGLATVGQWLWDAVLTAFFGQRVAWSLAQGSERLPTNLPRFNASMMERQVMRPLGGGYAFRHRYLEQHLVQGSAQAAAQVAVLITRLGQPEQFLKAKEGLIALLGSPSAVANALVDALGDQIYTPNARAVIGRALAELGDPRKGVGNTIIPVGTRNGASVQVEIPDFDWVTIPAGEFIYGDDNLDYAAKREILTLPAFQISRYLVTYRQFQAFINDPEGFYDRRWWEGLTMPNGDNSAPGDQAYKYWNHPRERVSWYDAIAFCRWMSWRLSELPVGTPNGASDVASAEWPTYDAMNPSTWRVRLPTEFEWERAARGTQGLIYPYGNEFDATKGNTRATGIGQTSAVGIFPHGASPDGVLDMSGNVWQWCLTEYNNPAPDAASENISATNRRVLRGGSWYDFRNVARAVHRGNYSPDSRLINFGFRVCVPIK
jgi:formylglycine-generating enzyme required for sulfatase activity